MSTALAPWSLRLLGALTLTRGERSVSRFRQQRTGLLLALLARVPGRALARDTVVEQLWPEVDPQVGRPRLRVLLAELRALLEEGLPKGSVLGSDNERIWLAPGAVASDLAAFDAARTAARTASTPVARAEALSAALAAYGGPFLPGVDDEWVELERRTLADQHQAAAMAAVEAWESAGRPAEALEALLRTEARDERSEETQGRLLRLFGAAGRAEAGLAHFRTWERQIPGRKAPSHLVRLAADLERSLVRPPTPAPPVVAAPGLRAWLAVAAPRTSRAALEAPLLARGALGPGSGNALVASFLTADDALEAAAVLRAIPGARLALDVASPEEGAARALALLYASPAETCLLGEAAAALLRQGALAPAGVSPLGRYDLPRLGAVVLWGLPDARGRLPVPAVPRSLEAPQVAQAPLFGRAEALAALMEAARPGAVATVTGIGGIGKTALARALLGVPDLAEERLFVDLTTSRDRASCLGALAVALGLELQRGDPLVAIAGRLNAAPRALVVLDNLEQVAAVAATLVSALQPRCPGVAWVCTSRVPLSLPGEVVLGLEGLALPHGALSAASLREVPSVALFLARARQQDPTFTVGAGNATVISALVCALHGIPLAIELAASRIRGWDPALLLDRLGARALDVLAWRERPGPARQSTLRAVLDWSWDLLEPWERVALATLSVFRGGFGADAAEAVVVLDGHRGAPFAMDVVEALVSHSLVRVLPPAWEGAPRRYGLYESVAEYAMEKLIDPRAVPTATGLKVQTTAWRRHARWYARLGAPSAIDSLNGADAVAARARLLLERDNLGVAIERAPPETPVALDLARALLELVQLFGRFEEVAPTVQALPDLREASARDLRISLALARYRCLGVTDDVPAVQAEAEALLAEAAQETRTSLALRRAGTLCVYFGSFDLTERYALAAVSAARSAVELALSESLLGTVYIYRGESQRAVDQLRQVLARCREGELVGVEAGCLLLLVIALTNLHRYREIGELAPELLSILRRVGGARLESNALGALGRAAIQTGALDEAQRYFEAGARVARRAGLRLGEQEHRAFLVNLCSVRGDWARVVADGEPMVAACLGVSPSLLGHLLVVSTALARTGRVTEGVALARQLVEAVGTFADRAAAWLCLGRCLQEAGLEEEANQALEQARSVAASCGPPDVEVLASGHLSEQALAVGDLARASALLAIPGPTGEDARDGEDAGLWAGWQGRLRAAQGDPRAAVALLAEAERIHRGLDATPDSDLGMLVGRLRADLAGSFFHLERPGRA